MGIITGVWITCIPCRSCHSSIVFDKVVDGRYSSSVRDVVVACARGIKYVSEFSFFRNILPSRACLFRPEDNIIATDLAIFIAVRALHPRMVGWYLTQAAGPSYKEELQFYDHCSPSVMKQTLCWH